MWLSPAPAVPNILITWCEAASLASGAAVAAVAAAPETELLGDQILGNFLVCVTTLSWAELGWAAGLAGLGWAGLLGWLGWWRKTSRTLQHSFDSALHLAMQHQAET